MELGNYAVAYLRCIAWHWVAFKLFVVLEKFTVYKGREVNATNNVVGKCYMINAYVALKASVATTWRFNCIAGTVKKSQLFL